MLPRLSMPLRVPALVTVFLFGGIATAGAQGAAPTLDSLVGSLKPRAAPRSTDSARGLRPSGAPPASTSANTQASPPVSAAVTPSRPPAHNTATASAATPAAANTSAPARPVVAAEPPHDAPSADLSVLFVSGSAELTPQAAQVLTVLGKALKSPELTASRFRIEGHTDTVGAADLNKSLSEMRARAVIEFLVGNFGIDRARLEAVGKGASELAVATPDQTPEPRNRRVHVVNLSG